MPLTGADSPNLRELALRAKLLCERVLLVHRGTEEFVCAVPVLCTSIGFIDKLSTAASSVAEDAAPPVCRLKALH